MTSERSGTRTTPNWRNLRRGALAAGLALAGLGLVSVGVVDGAAAFGLVVLAQGLVVRALGAGARHNSARTVRAARRAEAASEARVARLKADLVRDAATLRGQSCWRVGRGAHPRLAANHDKAAGLDRSLRSFAA